MFANTLQTKLHIPSLRQSLVSRPHLIDRLNAGRSGKLTLISAPAGFGKTTLVTAWLSQYVGDDTSVAWLSLDKGDNDSNRFLHYLIAALQVLEAEVGEIAVELLQSPQPPPIESILTELINEITQVTRHVILILDDYHTINAQPIHDVLTFLLDNMPPTMHLVIISRSDPPLPLPRLRVRGQMTEIRQADLRFTAIEAATFLNDVMGLSLSTGQIETLEARTEGWIAGLQLAALSMRDRDDVAEFVETFSGSHRFVMDYLAEEVIRGLPDDVQLFILQTSILNRLSGSLCDAVTRQSKSQEILEKLEQSNLFLIPLDDDRVWFRYHHLFMEVMLNRLQRFSPDQMPTLHLRAAKWFQQNGLYVEAIEHALSGNDDHLAADIVESQALSLLKVGSLTTLLGWLNQLPRSIVDQRPKLGIASAWVHLLTGKLESIEAYLSAAEKSLDDLDNSDELRGEVAAIRTYSAAQTGNLDHAIDQAHIASELLTKDNFAVRCVVAFVLGGIYLLRQDISRALEAMREAGQLGEQAGNIHVAVSALSAVGYVLHQQGNLAEAERVYYQAMQLGAGRSGKPLPISASVYSGLASLRLTQKDFVSARKFAQTGLELGEKWGNVDSQVGCYLTLAQLAHLESNLDKARETLDRAKHLAANYQLTPGLAEQIVACETAIFTTPPQADNSGLPDPLNEHELKVLRLIAAGLSNREAAAELFLSVNTVKWHLKNIYSKLHVRSRVEAITRAQELGLFS